MENENATFGDYVALATVVATTVWSVYQIGKLAKELIKAGVEHCEDIVNNAK